MNGQKQHDVLVLYVEDDAITREEVSDLLRRRVRSVLTAKNGQEGLAIFKSKMPDIIITDVAMPIMDGLTMARAIREIDVKIPIILMTAHSDAAYMLEAIDLGVDQYVLKPIETYKLTMALDKCAANINAHRTGEMLRESERIASATLDALSANIAILDETGKILAVNRAWRNFCEANSPRGFDGKVYEGVNYLSVCEASNGPCSEEGPVMAAGIRAVMCGRLNDFTLDYPCHSPTEKRWFTVWVTRFPGEGASRVVVAHENITARIKAEEELRKNEEKFRALFETARDGIFLLSSQGSLVAMNEAFARMHGYTVEEMLNMDLSDLDAPESARLEPERLQQLFAGEPMSFETEHYCKNGQTIPLEVSANLIILDEEKYILGFHRDISERRQYEQQVHQLAYYDALTHLPNRRLLHDRIVQALAASKRSGQYGALLFIDLDNFKPLNDKHGHAIGDLLLLEVARRIACCLREIDTLARFGGDEFVIILGEVDAIHEAAKAKVSVVAEKIRATLANPYFLELPRDEKAIATIEHHCTASIGVAMFTGKEVWQEEILKWADTAMYQAKKDGRNLIRFY